MNVRELIQKLTNYDMDAEVCVNTLESGAHSIAELSTPGESSWAVYLRTFHRE